MSATSTITVAIVIHAADLPAMLAVLHDRHEIFLYETPTVTRIAGGYSLLEFSTLASPLGLGLYLTLSSFAYPHYLEMFDRTVGRVQDEADAVVDTPLLFADDPDGYRGGIPVVLPAEHIDLGAVQLAVSRR